MKNILPKIINIVSSMGSSIGHVILRVCHCVEVVVAYLHDVKRTKDKEKEKAELKAKETEIDDVSTSGTLDDLFNLKKE